jgi:uncharacterized protein
MPFDAVAVTAQDLQLPPRGVQATVELLQGGATVPFIARYRKEVTGNLDEVQIRAIEERHAYLGELEARRQAVLESIASQGKLTPALRARIENTMQKAELEDLYLPFKPKRRTRATVARERGLEPLALRMLLQPQHANPRQEAQLHVGGEVPDVDAALAGAQDIAAEVVTDRADVRALAREVAWRTGMVTTKPAPVKKKQEQKLDPRFEEYSQFRERVSTVPSHRYLAVCRGEAEEVLQVGLDLDVPRLQIETLRMCGHKPGSAYAELLAAAVADGIDRLLVPATTTAVRKACKDRADLTAIDVFASNLRHLLLAPPLGARSVIGVDPGLRTGCKCVALDATGKLLGHLTIYLNRGEAGVAEAARQFATFTQRHQPEAIAVGNGTGGREAETFVRETLQASGSSKAFVVPVSEAGASVWSASDDARAEFPDLDVSVRGAVSIARRLQDPLAELVRIDPKAIGVGQYQHDVDQGLLRKKLDEVVEDCVHAVGVELNTASAALLRHVSGIGPAVAKAIVQHRSDHGPFASRRQVLGVAGLGPRAFELAAGFLRIRGGEQPLDASAVHPERYGLVQRIAKDLGVPVQRLVGNQELAEAIQITRYVDQSVGEPTLRDIVAELARPGRDPRATFEPPHFRDDIRKPEDLQPGMRLEGVVTNVTAFGAFVDLGVHQDGLIHVSELADRFVKDPREVVHVGQRLQVRVLEVDLRRRRIALSARTPRE